MRIYELHERTASESECDVKPNKMCKIMKIENDSHADCPYINSMLATSIA